MDVHELFELATTSSNTVVSSTDNPDNRNEGETYEHWGKRICGRVEGSLNALPPCLQKVRTGIVSEQARDKDRLAQAKENIKAEINRKKGEINEINEKIADKNSKIADTQQKIDSLKEERRQIEAGKEIVNKEQRMRMIIGLVILIPLTIYLFMFYSSTFYSAFFRNPQTIVNIMNTMFDPQALTNAYNSGLFELMFVLSAPIIFLGLGYVLHIFSIAEEKSKYFKMAAILLVTLMFDCILAYKIGEQMHTLGIIIGQFPVGEVYTISMALHDINTWAVIFCGFIVYVIWGFVFDMIMSAYSKMDVKKARLTAIDADLKNYEGKIESEKNEISGMKAQIKGLETNIQTLTDKLGSHVIISVGEIEKEMNNFFLGWIQMMSMLQISQTEQDKAKKIFDSELQGLLTE